MSAFGYGMVACGLASAIIGISEILNRMGVL